jgi:hypothetical protein
MNIKSMALNKLSYKAVTIDMKLPTRPGKMITVGLTAAGIKLESFRTQSSIITPPSPRNIFSLKICYSCFIEIN